MSHFLRLPALAVARLAAGVVACTVGLALVVPRGFSHRAAARGVRAAATTVDLPPVAAAADGDLPPAAGAEKEPVGVLVLNRRHGGLDSAGDSGETGSGLSVLNRRETLGDPVEPRAGSPSFFPQQRLFLRDGERGRKAGRPRRLGSDNVRALQRGLAEAAAATHASRAPHRRGKQQAGGGRGQAGEEEGTLRESVCGRTQNQRGRGGERGKDQTIVGGVVREGEPAGPTVNSNLTATGIFPRFSSGIDTGGGD